MLRRDDLRPERTMTAATVEWRWSAVRLVLHSQGKQTHARGESVFKWMKSEWSPE